MNKFNSGPWLTHIRYTIFLILLLIPCFAHARINVVAAENVYGNIVRDLGGDYVDVVSIIHTPAQDPHLFTITPSTAEALTNADIIIYNGANYDSWILPLLTPKIANKAYLIDVAKMQGLKTGDNPHLWYKPEVMLHFAQSMTALLSQIDKANQAHFENRLMIFENQYHKLSNRIQAFKSRYQGTKIIATEPIFNYLAEALGLDMRGIDFQVSNMNDIPPTISDVKQFQDDLKHHTVKALIYNQQVINPLTERMLALAQAEDIPVIGITEMMPENMNYFEWIEKQLRALENAFNRKTQATSPQNASNE